MDIELDIDGLHNALEASPNDQQALEGLVSFYRAEGAFEELTELYLGQLENQTERRLPLYQGLAEVMEEHLDLPEDARVVVLEGLQEFPTDETLWSQFRDLSETEEQLLEYVTLLKEIGLTKNSPLLITELILLIGELSEEEFALLFNRVQVFTVETRDESTMLNLWRELNEQIPEQRLNYLPNMLDVAIELGSIEALELVGVDVEKMDDDFVAQFISAIRNLAVEKEDAAISLMLKPNLASNKNETKTMTMSAIMDIAEALSDLEIVDHIDIGDEAFSDVLFERFMKLTYDECTAQKELSPLARQLAASRTWSDVRRNSLLSSLFTLSVELQDLETLLSLSPNLDNASQPAMQLFQSSVKTLCTVSLSESQFDTLISVIEAWDVSVSTDLIETLCLDSAMSEHIRLEGQEWLLQNATNDALDAFVEKYISESDDFDAIASLMRRRAQACDARQESPETQRHWRQRALSLNPSSTGLFDYFEQERVLEEADLIFLEDLVSQDQTDPRTALQIALRAMDFERRIEHADSWNELLVLAYRRSKTYDADHQKAIGLLKKTNNLNVLQRFSMSRHSLKKTP